MQIIFSGPLGSLSSLTVILKIVFHLSRCWGGGGGGLAGVAYFITGREQLQ